MENKRFFTYTAIAACMICAIAVAFNVFTDLELPGRIMAAILGVVITATIGASSGTNPKRRNVETRF